VRFSLLVRKNHFNPGTRIVPFKSSEPKSSLKKALSNAPLFFDQKRFLLDLDAGDPIFVFRNALSAAKAHFNNRFHEGEDVHTLVNETARFADLILRLAWERYEWDNDISLIAVGGYGRGELHPCAVIEVKDTNKVSSNF